MMYFQTASFVLLSTFAAAQKTITPTQSLLGPNFDGSHVDYGYSIRSSANYLIVGAPKRGDDDQGTIVIYDQDGHFQSTIEGKQGDRLGDRFDLSESLVAIRRKSTVEVYDVNTMQLIGQPIESKGGNSVALLDELLVISEESAFSQAGQVRLLSYDENNGLWKEQITLSALAPSGRFGHTVAFSDDGTRLAVSAPNALVEGEAKRGMVVVYENLYGTWIQLGEVLTGKNAGDTFGFSMAFSPDGDTLIVGAPGSNGDGIFRGEVSVYRLQDEDTWIQIGDVISGNLDRDRLGRALSCNYDGSRFVVSSYLHSGQHGQLRVFDLDESSNTYSETFQYVGERRKFRLGYGLLGVEMSVTGDRLLAGATWAGGEGSFSGKVDIFDLAAEAVVSPSETPSEFPTMSPSLDASSGPTELPSSSPSSWPSSAPTQDLSSEPSSLPTPTPSSLPTPTPSSLPTPTPTLTSSSLPSSLPTVQASLEPSHSPTFRRSSAPSFSPTIGASAQPSNIPTSTLSDFPSLTPTLEPTLASSSAPTTTKSTSPSMVPSSAPYFVASDFPTTNPSMTPSMIPSITPSMSPSMIPSEEPSESTGFKVPLTIPSTAPSNLRSAAPSGEGLHVDTLEGNVGPTSSASLAAVTITSIFSMIIVQVFM